MLRLEQGPPHEGWTRPRRSRFRVEATATRGERCAPGRDGRHLRAQSLEGNASTERRPRCGAESDEAHGGEGRVSRCSDSRVACLIRRNSFIGQRKSTREAAYQGCCRRPSRRAASREPLLLADPDRGYEAHAVRGGGSLHDARRTPFPVAWSAPAGQLSVLIRSLPKPSNTLRSASWLPKGATRTGNAAGCWRAYT